ncbi:hypothetical protein EDD85DRAFT_797797 [Armillaria nabsnona]|nr:hypothetical protein EDD85DRAFT_797797 [Armillaria nabsnona]
MKSLKDNWIRRGSFCLNHITATKLSESPSTKLERISVTHRLWVPEVSMPQDDIGRGIFMHIRLEEKMSEEESSEMRVLGEGAGLREGMLRTGDSSEWMWRASGKQRLLLLSFLVHRGRSTLSGNSRSERRMKASNGDWCSLVRSGRCAGNWQGTMVNTSTYIQVLGQGDKSETTKGEYTDKYEEQHILLERGSNRREDGGSKRSGRNVMNISIYSDHARELMDLCQSMVAYGTQAAPKRALLMPIKMEKRTMSSVLHMKAPVKEQ